MSPATELLPQERVRTQWTSTNKARSGLRVTFSASLLWKTISELFTSSNPEPNSSLSDRFCSEFASCSSSIPSSFYPEESAGLARGSRWTVHEFGGFCEPSRSVLWFRVTLVTMSRPMLLVFLLIVLIITSQFEWKQQLVVDLEPNPGATPKQQQISKREEAVKDKIILSQERNIHKLNELVRSLQDQLLQCQSSTGKTNRTANRLTEQEAEPLYSVRSS